MTQFQVLFRLFVMMTAWIALILGLAYLGSTRVKGAAHGLAAGFTATAPAAWARPVECYVFGYDLATQAQNHCTIDNEYILSCSGAWFECDAEPGDDQ